MTATFEIPAPTLEGGHRAGPAEAGWRGGAKRAAAGMMIRRPNVWIANC